MYVLGWITLTTKWFWHQKSKEFSSFSYDRLYLFCQTVGRLGQTITTTKMNRWINKWASTLPPVLPQTLCKSNKLTYIWWNRQTTGILCADSWASNMKVQRREGRKWNPTNMLYNWFHFLHCISQGISCFLLSTTGYSDRKFQRDDI